MLQHLLILLFQSDIFLALRIPASVTNVLHAFLWGAVNFVPSGVYTVQIESVFFLSKATAENHNTCSCESD